MLSTNFHSTYVDGATLLNALQLEAIIGPLDAALGKHLQAFAVARGPITQNGTTVKWPQIDVFHKQESTGAWIRQSFAANSTGIAVANGFALVGTVSDTDSLSLAAPAAVDMDSIATILNDRNKIVLVARSPMASGTGLLFYVALRPPQPLQGTTGLLTAASTTKTVNLPTGYTLPSAEYQVRLQQSAGAAFKGVIITAKTTTSFTIGFTAAVGDENYDYQIVPN